MSKIKVKIEEMSSKTVKIKDYESMVLAAIRTGLNVKIIGMGYLNNNKDVIVEGSHFVDSFSEEMSEYIGKTITLVNNRCDGYLFSDWMYDEVVPEKVPYENWFEIPQTMWFRKKCGVMNNACGKIYGITDSIKHRVSFSSIPDPQDLQDLFENYEQSIDGIKWTAAGKEV